MLLQKLFSSKYLPVFPWNFVMAVVLKESRRMPLPECQKVWQQVHLSRHNTSNEALECLWVDQAKFCPQPAMSCGHMHWLQLERGTSGSISFVCCDKHYTSRKGLIPHSGRLLSWSHWNRATLVPAYCWYEHLSTGLSPPQHSISPLNTRNLTSLTAFGVSNSRTGWMPTRPLLWDGVHESKESDASNTGAFIMTRSCVNDLFFTMECQWFFTALSDL